MLFEDLLCELIEAAAPCMPLVGCALGYKSGSFHTHLVEGIGCFQDSRVLLASAAHENQLGSLLESLGGLYILRADGSTAEHAYISELGRVGQSDAASLAPTH